MVYGYTILLLGIGYLVKIPGVPSFLISILCTMTFSK